MSIRYEITAEMDAAGVTAKIGTLLGSFRPSGHFMREKNTLIAHLKKKTFFGDPILVDASANHQ
jgi:hypothetical protein